MEIDWTVISLMVIALFALAGYFKGWWKEAIVTVFLAFLVLLLQVPSLAKAFIDVINFIIEMIWRILPGFVLDFVISTIDTLFGIGAELGKNIPPQINANSSQTWIIMLIIFVGLAILIGHLRLPGSARTAKQYSGYSITWGGRIFGGLVGALNAWLIITLVRAYLEGGRLPGNSELVANPSADTDSSVDLAVRAVNLPTATILDSFLPWLFIAIGLGLSVAALVSRIGIHEDDGYRKLAYKSPVGYKKIGMKFKKS